MFQMGEMGEAALENRWQFLMQQRCNEVAKKVCEKSDILNHSDEPTAEPKTPGVPWCFEFFVPNIKHKGTPRILSKLLKPQTSLVFRGVLKPTKFFMS